MGGTTEIDKDVVGMFQTDMSFNICKQFCTIPSLTYTYSIHKSNNYTEKHTSHHNFSENIRQTNINIKIHKHFDHQHFAERTMFPSL